MMRKKQIQTCLTLGLLVGVGVLSGCQVSPRVSERNAEQRRLVSQAEQFKNEGLLEAALAAFEMVLDDNPRQTDAHIGIGDIYEIKGDYEEAADKYKTAKTIDPTNYKATYKLGLMYHLLNRVQAAIAEYLDALAIRPNSFEANLNLATAYLQINEPQLGLPYAEAAVKLNADSQTAHTNLGSIYAALGQYNLAIDEYRAAAELGELKPQLALNLAESLLKTGRYQQALNTLKAVQRTNDTGAVRERLGYAYFKLGEYQSSLAAYESSLEIAPQDTGALNGMGVNLMTLYLQGRREDTSLRNRAIGAWQKSVSIDPNQQRIIDLIARYRKL
jgi:tetratricopeptide (TPR) repeat protein